MSGPVDLSELMVATQAGDEDAYRQLLHAVQPLLLRYVRRRISSPESAEDIAQDVLLTMHRVRQTYEPGRPFEPWFYTIARSRVIDHLRKRRRIGAHEIHAEVLPEIADDAVQPDWEQFLELLDTLSPSQREAFTLLKIDGLSTQEAAERAGVSVTALKVRAHRAYNALRKLMLAGEDG